MGEDYVKAFKTGSVGFLRSLSMTGRDNIDAIFKGFPSFPMYVQDVQTVGKWDVKYQSKIENALGYFLPCSPLDEGIALLKDGQTWMSITPLEVESHMLPQYAAKGNVVIAGLGLGMIVNSLLNKKTVSRITVLEIDDELIANYSILLQGHSKKLWEESLSSGRLQLLKCDCKKTIPREIKDKIGAIDYLWVDIWPVLGSEAALFDTQYLCKQLRPRVCDFWGMELEAVSEMSSQKLQLKSSNVLKALSYFSIPFSVNNMNKKQKTAYSQLALMASVHVCLGTSKKVEKQSN